MVYNLVVISLNGYNENIAVVQKLIGAFSHRNVKKLQTWSNQ